MDTPLDLGSANPSFILGKNGLIFLHLLSTSFDFVSLFSFLSRFSFCQSWALGTLKVMTISVPITAHFLKSNDDNDTRYRFLILFKQKNILLFFRKILPYSILRRTYTSSKYIRSGDAMLLNRFFTKRVAKMSSFCMTQKFFRSPNGFRTDLLDYRS